MTIIKGILATIGTFFAYILGGFDIALQCLVISISLDYITGFMKAYKTSTLNSNTGLVGIFKKVAMLCLVSLAVILDMLVGETGIIRTLVIYYLVANEGLSIVENLGELGILIPEIITEKLEQLKNKGE